jgi:hypothetical protein
MNVANSVLCKMEIILKAYKVNLFVSSLLFVFWYHSPNFLDKPHSVAEWLIPTFVPSFTSWKLCCVINKKNEPGNSVISLQQYICMLHKRC